MAFSRSDDKQSNSSIAFFRWHIKVKYQFNSQFVLTKHVSIFWRIDCAFNGRKPFLLTENLQACSIDSILIEIKSSWNQCIRNNNNNNNDINGRKLTTFHCNDTYRYGLTLSDILSRLNILHDLFFFLHEMHSHQYHNQSQKLFVFSIFHIWKQKQKCVKMLY